MSSQDEKPPKKTKRIYLIASALVGLALCCIVGLIGSQDADQKPTQTVEMRAATIALPTDPPPTETQVIPTATATQLPTETAIPAPTIQPSTETPITGINLISRSETVHVGSDARISILTTPGLECHIIYTTPSGNISEADGLGTTIADSTGRCGWVWTIGFNTAPGTGSILVTAGEYSHTWEITIQ